MLLDGSLNQKDDQIGRDMFAFLQGLIVKPEESEEIVELFEKAGKNKSRYPSMVPRRP